MQVFLNNDTRFCYQSKEKVLSSLTLLKECKYETKKIKMKNVIYNDLEKSSSDESDNNSHDKAKSDNEKDKYESNE